MSLEIRPEYFDTDTAEFFTAVPQFNTTGATWGELLGLVGFVVEDVDSAGFVDAGMVLRGVEEQLALNYEMSPFLRGRMVNLLAVASWAVEHGRQIEWC
jgi:hypothetical protein